MVASSGSIPRYGHVKKLADEIASSMTLGVFERGLAVECERGHLGASPPSTSPKTLEEHSPSSPL